MADQDNLSATFLTEVEALIAKHSWAYTKDAGLYQSIVISSAICGILSLFAGAVGYSITAGVLGGATTIASVLTQTLHCVKAQGWQDRMKAELEGIRLQFIYEHGGVPTPEALADLAKQRRDLVSQMSKEWEKILNSQGGGFNFRLQRGKKGSKETQE
ncbi:hypothetical protein NLM31_21890 [Bradyrhizobium sp. CCGUVB4N]|uniref:hypothetical protein n=1 Tax=Bradyrhizobium sp. CCGUVB4N TaxID=2949631 RepID=UPI0020B1960F|nr:hypothetical protein [Bradyrhizobium sp. CCGUVB4N]MCP3383023.1 hypothetical protein [Bradyrhizobium sp. CCGUVB4N]